MTCSFFPICSQLQLPTTVEHFRNHFSSVIIIILCRLLFILWHKVKIECLLSWFLLCTLYTHTLSFVCEELLCIPQVIYCQYFHKFDKCKHLPIPGQQSEVSLDLNVNELGRNDVGIIDILSLHMKSGHQGNHTNKTKRAWLPKMNHKEGKI